MIIVVEYMFFFEKFGVFFEVGFVEFVLGINIMVV